MTQGVGNLEPDAGMRTQVFQAIAAQEFATYLNFELQTLNSKLAAKAAVPD